MRQLAQVIRREDKAVWVKLDNPAKECGNCKDCMRLSGKENVEEVVLKLSDPSGAYQPGDRVFLKHRATKHLRQWECCMASPSPLCLQAMALPMPWWGLMRLQGWVRLWELLVGAAVSALGQEIANR